MTNRLRLLVLLCLSCLCAFASAQGTATWSAKLDRSDVRAGEVARVVITVELEKGSHTYSIVPVDLGPFPTTIKPPKGDGVESAGAIEEQKPHVEFDENFKKDVGSFTGTAEFYAPIKIKEGTSGPQTLTVDLKYMVCNAQNCSQPTPVTLPVAFTVEAGAARPEFTKLVPRPATTPPASSGPTQPSDATSNEIRKARESGIWAFLLVAFGAGLLSLLTPCVFPMIPITVSFFAKQKTEGEKLSYAGPISYCLGIIGTFTGLGVVIGATGLGRIATNPWVNIGLAVLFVVLAASLFGVFEIRLPHWLVNKASAKSRSGGLLGPFLMGLTFTLTSFTCTAPFVGSLLVPAAQQGLFYSIIGMLAYSIAFALPFFFLALFPSLLSKLPRSGAWLVTVKAYMGFLELMAALKFLSNVDLAFDMGLLTRPVFLALWSMIAGVGGLYLLGWLRLPHDSETKVGWFRRGFAVATIALAVFCLAGIDGRRLGTLAAFLPPDPYPGQAAKKAPLVWESTYAAALEQAKSVRKNIFIDFTGIYCTNCRAIEENVFTQPQVDKVLRGFVLARLFTDHQTPEDDANQALQRKLSGVDSLPLYAVISPDGAVLKIHQQQAPIEDAKQLLDAIQSFSGSAR